MSGYRSANRLQVESYEGGGGSRNQVETQRHYRLCANRQNGPRMYHYIKLEFSQYHREEKTGPAGNETNRRGEHTVTSSLSQCASRVAGCDGRGENAEAIME